MKLRQKVDKEIDQNEIESKYYWNFGWNKTINRINLAELAFDLSNKQSSEAMKNCITIDNNRIVGIMGSELFILDEFFDIEIIDTYQSLVDHSLHLCYYDNSIFVLEDEYNSNSKSNRGIDRHFKRYLISQNRWYHLFIGIQTDIYGCIGFKQKIIITSKFSKMTIYDINLNSYTEHSPIKILFMPMNQIMFKKSGKLYWIANTVDGNKCYYCDDPLSEWIFVCNYNERYDLDFSPKTYYNDSFYYFREPKYYIFSLSKFKTNEIKIRAQDLS